MLRMMDQHLLSYFKKWRSLRLRVSVMMPRAADVAPTPPYYIQDVCLEPDTSLQLGATILGFHSSLVRSTAAGVCSKGDDGVPAYVRYYKEQQSSPRTTLCFCSRAPPLCLEQHLM